MSDDGNAMVEDTVVADNSKEDHPTEMEWAKAEEPAAPTRGEQLILNSLERLCNRVDELTRVVSQLSDCITNNQAAAAEAKATCPQKKHPEPHTPSRNSIPSISSPRAPFRPSYYRQLNSDSEPGAKRARYEAETPLLGKDRMRSGSSSSSSYQKATGSDTVTECCNNNKVAYECHASPASPPSTAKTSQDVPRKLNGFPSEPSSEYSLASEGQLSDLVRERSLPPHVYEAWESGRVPYHATIAPWSLPSDKSETTPRAKRKGVNSRPETPQK